VLRLLKPFPEMREEHPLSSRDGGTKDSGQSRSSQRADEQANRNQGELMARSEGDNGSEERCRLEGTFILEGAGGVHVLDQAFSLDPANEQIALHHDLADYDATLGGLFPTAVRYSTAQGEAIRTGPRSFDYTLLYWGLDDANRRVSMVFCSGTKLFREGDCGTYDTVGNTLAVYLVGQDADGDGVPDVGETPVACVPLELTGRRLSIRPPCTPSSLEA
jgi:hypothetical protein